MTTDEIIIRWESFKNLNPTIDVKIEGDSALLAVHCLTHFSDLVDRIRELEKAKDEYMVCPWCSELDFDLIGLKTHIENGWCENYEKCEKTKKL